MATTRLDFAAQVDAWVKKTKKRMLVVFQAATEYTFDDVYDNTPKVTTFLAQSFGASLDAMPTIDPNAQGFSDYAARVQPYDLVITEAQLGDTIYGGFVAAYARRTEYGFTGVDSLGREYNQTGRGMVRLAAQNWRANVSRAIAEAKAAVK
ncbi:HK97 gp10 family phage protein [Roseibium sp. RKSG952]|uniref:HK97 gp10 family phage protein n=1 Tax=Roseibium sp. RKSG952 TaxID=2529384 RepID=UPI0012BBBE1F|nr:HK97 gp10 family phage protein [Roseibium sp. RKSG952]MTH96418.1 HK97 gp10 family phage protein [Roseibium sp. RKSG952]